MSQENFSDKQEGMGSISVNKIFDAKDEARIAELNEKFEQPTVVNNEELSRNFPGTIILKKSDGIHLAVSKDANGIWKGSRFSLMNDGGVGAVYQEHKIDDQIIQAAEAQMKVEADKKLTGFKSDLRSLFNSGEKTFNSFSSQSSEEAKSFRKKLNELSESDQEELGEDFFENTIGQSILNIRDAYPVYLALRGTPFAKKFAAKEDARLKENGYAGFIL